jgi:hypothetical protein
MKSTERQIESLAKLTVFRAWSHLKVHVLDGLGLAVSCEDPAQLQVGQSTWLTHYTFNHQSIIN